MKKVLVCLFLAVLACSAQSVTVNGQDIQIGPGAMPDGWQDNHNNPFGYPDDDRGKRGKPADTPEPATILMVAQQLETQDDG